LFYFKRTLLVKNLDRLYLARAGIEKPLWTSPISIRALLWFVRS
jgi:hypothetical protein